MVIGAVVQRRGRHADADAAQLVRVLVLGDPARVRAGEGARLGPTGVYLAHGDRVLDVCDGGARRSGAEPGRRSASRSSRNDVGTVSEDASVVCSRSLRGAVSFAFCRRCLPIARRGFGGASMASIASSAVCRPMPPSDAAALAPLDLLARRRCTSSRSVRLLRSSASPPRFRGRPTY